MYNMLQSGETYMKSAGRPAGSGASVAGGGGVGAMQLGWKQRNTFRFTAESTMERSTLLRRRRWLVFPDTADTEGCEQNHSLNGSVNVPV